MEVVRHDSSAEKKFRKRKKKIYSSIKEQMEFYFSDANLIKDKFLKKLLSESNDGYISLEVFKKFNKIRALTDNIEDIANALSSSELLQVSPSHDAVRRTKVLKEKTDVDECTVYAERLPSYADHDWLKSVFSRFGNVAYVSLPRFKSSGKIKGFAFIEFEKLDHATKACEFFKSHSEQESSEENVESKHEKCSEIKDKSPDAPSSKHKDVLVQKCNKKRKRQDSESDRSDKAKYNTKFSDSNDESKDKTSESDTGKNTLRRREHGDESWSYKKRKRSVSQSEDHDETVKHREKNNENNVQHAGTNQKEIEHGNNESAAESETSEVSVKQASLHKKIKLDDSSEIDSDCRPNKKSYGNKEQEELTHSDENSQKKYQISERQLQQESLDREETLKQDNGMEDQSSKKKKKRKHKKKSKHAEDNENVSLRVMSKAEWKGWRNKYLTLQRTTMSYIKKTLMLDGSQWTGNMDDSDVDDGGETSVGIQNREQASKPDKQKSETAIKFQPGVIIKVVMPEPLVSTSEFKKQVRSYSGVAYIDVTEGHDVAYVRCYDPEKATKILKESKSSTLGFMELLRGNEETDYWKKIENDREAKFNSNTKQKKRGRERIMAKAAKMSEKKNTHVHFDD